MSTTTSDTPEPEGAPSAGPRSDTPAECGGGHRPARLIHNEVTTEIPVHLLFRDDPDPVSVPLAPAVVGRRRGTGEQPRIRRPVPGRPPRPVPEVDPDLVERPARVLPGAAGVLAGACGVAGCALTTWWAGLLPPAVPAALELHGSVGAGLGPAQWAAYAGAGALGLFGFGVSPAAGPAGPGCSVCSGAIAARSGAPG